MCVYVCVRVRACVCARVCVCVCSLPHLLLLSYGLRRFVSDQCSALFVCLFVSLQSCVCVCTALPPSSPCHNDAMSSGSSTTFEGWSNGRVSRTPHGPSQNVHPQTASQGHGAATSKHSAICTGLAYEQSRACVCVTGRLHPDSMVYALREETKRNIRLV